MRLPSICWCQIVRPLLARWRTVECDCECHDRKRGAPDDYL